jgi:hypothetical protein
MAKKAKAKALRAGAGKSFKGWTAVVIFRKTGQVLNKVTVLDKAFKVETPDLGTLTFKTTQIKTIVYKNLPTYPTDMLKTVGGSEINGTIANDPVRMTSPDLGGAASIAKASLLSIIW